MAFRTVVFILSLLSLTSTERTVITGKTYGNSCDKDGDWNPLTEGQQSVIWAYNKDDPRHVDGSDAMHHDRKGGTKIDFREAAQVEGIGGLEKSTKRAYAKHVKGPIEYGKRNMTTEGTLYYSHGFDLWEIFPEANEHTSVHMTKWDVFYGTDKDGSLNTDYIHHVNMIPCTGGLDEGLSTENWGESSVGVSEDLKNCWLDRGVNPIVVFVLGMEPQVFPKDAGIKIGGPDGYRYVLMETHYDIPWYQPEGQLYGAPVPEDFYPVHPNDPTRDADDFYLYDDSGIQFWYTVDLRPKDIGPVWIGIYPERNTSIVPAGQENFKTVSLHNPNCFREFFPPEGKVKIFQILLHGHTEATAIRVRHIRDGVELPLMAQDETYDNYYQQWLDVDIEWHVDDEIIVECVIDSSEYQYSLIHGLNTDEQMCIAFFMIYPSFGLYSLIEWSEDHRVCTQDLDSCKDVEGKFMSVNGPCAGETYYYPDIKQPLVKTDPCRERVLKDKFMEDKDTEPKPWREEEDGKFDTNNYKHHQVLDKGQGMCSLHYNYDAKQDIIDFALECNSNGWIGMGFSPNGGMINADILMGWVDDYTGEVHVHDRFATEQALPLMDITSRYWDVRAFQDGVLPPLRHIIKPTYEKTTTTTTATVQPTKSAEKEHIVEVEPTPVTQDGSGAVAVLAGLFGLLAGIAVACAWYRRTKRAGQYIDTPTSEFRSVA